MPRSYSNWNEHRRQGVNLFPVPSLPSDAMDTVAEDDNSRQADQQLSSSFNDLEELVNQLLEDGSPPGGFLGLSPAAASTAAATTTTSSLTSLASAPYQAPSTSIPGFDPCFGREAPNTEASMSSLATTTASIVQQQQPPLSMPPPPPRQPAQPLQASPQAHEATSLLSAQLAAQPASQPAALPSVMFTWQERQECLVESDFNGSPIEQRPLPAAGSNPVQVSLDISPPLLYWQDRRQWMWHKKWALPTLTVRVCRSDQPVGERLYAYVTAGTLRDEEPGLHDKGLGGECQRLLEVGPQGTAVRLVSKM